MKNEDSQVKNEKN